MAREQWIKGSVKRPGALGRRAKTAGISIAEYAQKHRHNSGLAGQQSRWYLNVRRLGK